MRSLHFGGYYLIDAPRRATGTKSPRAGSPYGGIGAVLPDVPRQPAPTPQYQ